MVGAAFILYWHAKGLMDLSRVSENKDATTEDNKSNSTHQRIQAHFLGLGVLPVWICLAGGSSAVNRFLFNGYGSFYAAFAMEPLLKQAVVSSPATSSLRWKLQFLRVLFPSWGFSFVAESLIVEHLQIDPHGCRCPRLGHDLRSGDAFHPFHTPTIKQGSHEINCAYLPRGAIEYMKVQCK